MRKTGVLEIVLPDVATAIEEEPDRAERYQSYLEALDAKVASGYEPTPAVVFGSYLLPIVFPESFLDDDPEAPRPDGARTEHRIESVLGDLIPRLRLSRRDAGRLRQVLMAQRRLAPSRRRRRFSRTSIARQGYFPEALALFEIHCSAVEGGSEELDRWKVALERVPKSPTPSRRPGGGGPPRGRRDRPAPRADEEESSAPKKKRRPRKRRRRRKPSSGSPESS
jgi:hypothetical protein